MKRMALAFICALMILSGCTDYKQLEFKSYSLGSMESVTFKSGALSAGVTLDVEVANPTGSKFSISGVKATVYNESGKRFAEVNCPETVEIAPRSDGDITFPLDVTLFNPISMLATQGINLDGMTADIDLVFKSGVTSKKISAKGVELKEALKCLSELNEKK